MFVNAGFILGFDSERGGVARGMIDCIEDTAIPVCMVGLLYALPNTQLTRRLLREGRLHADHDRVSSEEQADQCSSGLNFETARPRADVLDDYKNVLAQIYAPAAYFGRVRRVAAALDVSKHKLRQPLRHIVRDLRAFARLTWRLGVRDTTTRRHWWQTLLATALRNPRALRPAMSMIALYLHLGPYARELRRGLEGQLQEMESGRWQSPVALPKSAVA